MNDWYQINDLTTMFDVVHTIDGNIVARNGEEVNIMNDELIKQYDDKSYKINFVKGGKYKKLEEDLFLGFEVEFELPHSYNTSKKHNQVAQYIKDNFSDFIAECKHDGSLINGFEAVSHPTHIGVLFTKAFKKRLSALFDYLKSIGACTCQTTGLHFHVSNAYIGSDGNLQDIQAKICLLCNTLQDELKELSNRYDCLSYRDAVSEYDMCGDFVYPKMQLFQYCNFYNNTNSFRTSVLKHSLPYGHRCAINCGNTTTTEFRFFAGTLNYDEFIKDASLVVGICRMAKSGKTMSLKGIDKCMPVKNELINRMKEHVVVDYELYNLQDLKVILDNKINIYSELYTKLITLIPMDMYYLQKRLWNDISYYANALCSGELDNIINQYNITLDNINYAIYDDITIKEREIANKLLDVFMKGVRYKYETTNN